MGSVWPKIQQNLLLKGFLALVAILAFVGCSNPLSKGEDGTNSFLSSNHNPFLDLVQKTAFVENFDFNSSLNYQTTTGGEVTGGVAQLTASDSTISLTDDASATAADTSLSDYALKDANINVASDQVVMTSGATGQYISPVIDGKNSTTPWSLLNFRTSFPFGKELPSFNAGIQNESAADYPSAQTNLMTSNYAVWHLNESSGTSFADDAGGGNTGSIVGGVTVGGVGRFGRAPTFNGSTGYITTPNITNNPTVFTVSAWFKTSSVAGGYVVGFGNTVSGASASYDRHIYMSNAGNIIFGIYPGSVRTIVSPGVYNDGNWHHAVGSVSAAGQSLYIDGNLISNVPANTVPQVFNGYWRIGFQNVAGAWTSAPTTKYWNGQIDEVAVWYRGLTAAEVSSLYRRGANRLKLQLRTCTAASGNDCAGTVTSWVGPDGTSSTFFSETHNSTNPVTLLGMISPSFFQTAWSLFTGGFSAWLSTGTNQTNQYIQVKAVLESDTALYYPDLKSVTLSPQPRYATLVKVYNTSAAAISFFQITNMAVQAACGDANANSLADDIRFEFSTDAGATYRSWTGSAWAVNSVGFGSANNQSLIESLTADQWALLPNDTDKQIYVRVYLTSSGTTSCQINNIQVTGLR